MQAEKEQFVQSLTAQMAEKEQSVQALTVQVAEKEQSVQALTVQVAEKEPELNEIYRSPGWSNPGPQTGSPRSFF